MSLVVVYDADALYPSTPRDVLLRVGPARPALPRRTGRILEEVFDESPCEKAGRGFDAGQTLGDDL